MNVVNEGLFVGSNLTYQNANDVIIHLKHCFILLYSETDE